ncbi:hypothetical protein AMEX_G4017 [Astyanax mexicanus]|uniref:Uncharacterized protein n=1 Tax=Astyanax mexicanus TaxID=7994 RepID=A0A8T2M9U0_ASTMX|nr:hypothetical protein AMEX_G4017 [Astyanax mexicanus]
MRTLFLLIVLSFHIALSFSLPNKPIVRIIVKDLNKLSPELRSSLHSTLSFNQTCDCDLLAMKHLKQMLDNINPKDVSPSDKEQLGRIILNLGAVHHKKKEEEKNCLKKTHQRLRKRTTTVVPHYENLQHWLRKCE